MATLEDVLYARAQQRALENDDVTLEAGAGALLGGVTGAIGGEAQMKADDLMKRAKNMVRGVETPDPTILDRARPGMRMAGGLVCAILGGALGAGAKQQLIAKNPAADILAKLQVQGDLSAADQQALQNVLADTYATSTLAM